MALRARLAAAVKRGSLPASLLLHGQRGIGKQRLALGLAQHLLCTAPPAGSADGDRPNGGGCGACEACSYAADLTHPDLHWVFPQPRPKDGDAEVAAVQRRYAEVIRDRVQRGLLYGPPDGADALFVATVRALLHRVALTPAMGSCKVLVVGDAERMVPQEGAEAAANAFLKILEEPPADTFIILTSSEPGALLPTIRSRVVSIRVPALSDADVSRWVREPRVREALDSLGMPGDDAARVRKAHGAPGSLLGGTQIAAMASAQALQGAMTSHDPGDRYRAALQQGAMGARGEFSATLDALTELLRNRAMAAVQRGDADSARTAARAVPWVEDAQGRAEGNVSPQLLTAELLRRMALASGRRS